MPGATTRCRRHWVCFSMYGRGSLVGSVGGRRWDGSTRAFLARLSRTKWTRIAEMVATLAFLSSQHPVSITAASRASSPVYLPQEGSARRTTAMRDRPTGPTHQPSRDERMKDQAHPTGARGTAGTWPRTPRARETKAVPRRTRR